MKFFVRLWTRVMGLGIEKLKLEVMFFVILWKHVTGLGIEKLKLSAAK